MSSPKCDICFVINIVNPMIVDDWLLVMFYIATVHTYSVAYILVTKCHY